MAKSRFFVHCKIFELRGGRNEIIDNFKTSPEKAFRILRQKYSSKVGLLDAIMQDWDLSRSKIEEMIEKLESKKGGR